LTSFGNLNSTSWRLQTSKGAVYPAAGEAMMPGLTLLADNAIMRHDKRRFIEKLDFITTPGISLDPCA